MVFLQQQGKNLMTNFTPFDPRTGVLNSDGTVMAIKDMKKIGVLINQNDIPEPKVYENKQHIMRINIENQIVYYEHIEICREDFITQ